MAAPRASSFKVLRALSQHRRHLHITGVNSAPAVTASEKSTSIWLSKTTSELAAECRRRNLRPLGSKSELMERITAHDTLQSRAFSIALKRINPGSQEPQAATATRHLNTSRAHKAVGDNSTIDFVFLPTNLDHSLHDESFNMRVPILPDSYHIGSIQSTIETAPVMRPEIYSVSGSPDIAGPSPMSEVSDNTAMDIDPFSLTETVTRAAQKVVDEGKQEVSSVKDFLGGFVEDLLGPRKGSSLV